MVDREYESYESFVHTSGFFTKEEADSFGGPTERKMVRAVALQTDQPPQAKPRQVFMHTYDRGAMSCTPFKDGDKVPYSDIVRFSNSDHMRVDSVITAVETVFNSDGSLVEVDPDDSELYTPSLSAIPQSCVVCYARLLGTPSFNIARGDAYATRCAYLMSVSAGRTLCDNCFYTGFAHAKGEVPPGGEPLKGPIDTMTYLKTRGPMKSVQIGSLAKPRDGITAHAYGRIDRTNTNYKLSMDQVLSMDWKLLRNDVPYPKPEESDDEEDVAAEYAELAGSRAILVAGLDHRFWEGKMRKLNCDPVLYAAAVVIDSYNSRGDLDKYYKILTFLPTACTIDMRYQPTNVTLKMIDQDEITDEEGIVIKKCLMLTEAIELMENDTITTKPSYKITEDDHPYPRMLSSFLNAFTGTGYKRCSQYKVRRCYSCHRVKRADNGRACSGMACPYAGRVPLYNGKSLTNALREFLLTCAREGHLEVNVLTGDEYGDGSNLDGHKVDVFVLRRATRCEFSGRCFVCVNIADKLLRPKFALEMNDINTGKPKGSYYSCGPCFFKLQNTQVRSNNLFSRVRRVEKADYEETFFVVKYMEGKEDILNNLFIGVECPTVFPKTAPFAIPMIDPKDDIQRMFNYLSTAKGYETELVSPFVVDGDGSGDRSANTIDAWDNQHNMTWDGNEIPGEYAYSVANRFSVPKKRNISELCDHLGPASLVLVTHTEDDLLVSSIANANVRYAIFNRGEETIYIPHSSGEVSECIYGKSRGWLQKMGKEYVSSLHQALIQFRLANKRARDHAKSKAKNAGIGASKPIDPSEEIIRTVLNFAICGANTSPFMKKLTLLYAPENFGMSGSGIAPQLRKIDKYGILNDLIARIRIRYLAMIGQGATTSSLSAQLTDVRAATASVFDGEFGVAIINVTDPVDGKVKQLPIASDTYRAIFSQFIDDYAKTYLGGSLVPDTKKLMNTSTSLCAVAVTISTKEGFVNRMMPCSEGGITTSSYRPLREVYDENFLWLRPGDERITPVGAQQKRLLKTPPVIWFEASRAATLARAKNAVIVSLAAEQRRLTGKVSDDEDELYLSAFEMCYLEWDQRLMIKFPKVPDVIMVWDVNIKKSTLTSTRMITVVPATSVEFPNPSNYFIVCLRDAPINALKVMSTRVL